MKYKLYKNSNTGMHCVQACLQMLLHYFGRTVLTFKELDEISGHPDPKKGTWMSKALLWLHNEGFEIIMVENLDYSEFAKRGEEYLKSIWNGSIFDAQKITSDLEQEQLAAKQLVASDIVLQNRVMNLNEIRDIHAKGYFTLLSVNACTLRNEDGYAPHLIVIKKFNLNEVEILDPDFDDVRVISYERLKKSISVELKPDFNVIFVKNPANQ